jgi:hypothetical protein
MMMLNLTDAEQEFLLELLEARHTSMLHELHHTDTYEYKRMLEQKVDLLENLREKLQHVPSTAPTE